MKLYQSYTGKYAVVLGKVRSEEGVYVRYGVLGSDEEYCMPASEFFGDTFVREVVEDGKCRKDVLPISQHPDNVTGQNVCHREVKDLDSFGKNLSTQELINELNNREDSPLADLDIEGFNGRVWCRDYVIGDPVDSFEFSGNKMPRNVSVWEVHNTYKEAKEKLFMQKVKSIGIRSRIYKRVFIEVN